jgi:hypothetical protein
MLAKILGKNSENKRSELACLIYRVLGGSRVIRLVISLQTQRTAVWQSISLNLIEFQRKAKAM